MWVEGRALFREAEGLPGRAVKLALDMRGLGIRDLADHQIALWPFGRLVRSNERNAFVILLKDGHGRVEITDPAASAAFAAALKAIPAAGDPRVPRGCLDVTLFAAVIAAALVALAMWGLSTLAETFAPMVPEEVTAALDDASRQSVLELFGTDESRRCTAPAGNAALGALAGRLADAGGARTHPRAVAVYRSKVPNAVALPGGTILVTDTLLARAGTLDAFAGVLAHEIGHVHHRHGLRKLLHEGGLLVALAVVTGDATGIVGGGARALLGAAYSRDAEREADDFSVDALAAAGGDPRRLGPFLRDLDSDAGGFGTAILSTHPLSTEREAAITIRAAEREVSGGPLLTSAEEAALRAICD